MLKVFFAGVCPLNDDGLYRQAVSQLSPYRRGKAESYVFRKDRNLSAGAGLLLDSALRELGLREAEMQYREGPHGKPYFADKPGLFFNLSHSGERVMAVLSDREVGCDIERIGQESLAFAKRIYRSGEYRLIAEKADPAEQNEMFFHLWTLKESYMKAAGAGLSLAPDSFEIAFRSGRPYLSSLPEREEYTLAEIPFSDGYRSALCVKGKCALETEMQVTEVDLSCFLGCTNG